MDIEYDLIAQWFDITQQQWRNNYSNFVIIIPVYTKRIGISKDENKILIKYEIHKFLLDECVLRKTDYGEESRKSPDIPLKELQIKELQTQDVMAIVKIDIEAADFSKYTNIGIAIIHNEIHQLYHELLSHSDLSGIIKPKINYIQELMQQVITQFNLNSNLSEYKNKNAPKNDPFELYVYYLFNQLFPCIWFGLFENADFLKKTLESMGVENICDFFLLDNQRNGSVILIECTRQFLGKRNIIAEYEDGKLTYVKEHLTQKGHTEIYAILACNQQYSTNPALFDNVIHRFGNKVHFFFKEDLEEIQSNEHAIIKHTDIIKYSRNFKIPFSED